MTKRFNRSRRVFVRPSDVKTDGDGNIISMPIIAGLPCFADPVKYFAGVFDTPSKRVNARGEIVEQPRGCAGCKSRAACGTTAYGRVMGDPELHQLHGIWESATQPLTGKARYKHPTFVAFAAACTSRAWTSSNDEALPRMKAEKAKQTRQDRRQRQRQQRKLPVSVEEIRAAEAACEERMATLAAAALAPGAPVWLRNLPGRTIHLTCDVWLTHRLIELRRRGEVTGGDILRAMVEAGNTYDLPDRSLRSRINEALRRIARLETEPVEAPVWPSSY
ncbi:hypothetical protein [Sphingopyxis sp. RIFCSPHIGHO2_12_FULL_65_19]|uniref:hypothetical protein n=1 Tax=Sphingopyxis sp. RIFCSPHIGHO2_12_FULL_65_19 TaxID=1802172 RepID=UPI0025CC2419|nr:hypothetical protein [Sphingopyxis sp. RIFCSPHIGHO2_12_FULL_65_19]